MSGQNSIAHPTALSNEIIVNVDDNFFIVVFKAKYAANYRFYVALATPSWTPTKSPNSTLSLAGATRPPFPGFTLGLMIH
jgi:O-antigen/teichoic acid export membrane protein